MTSFQVYGQLVILILIAATLLTIYKHKTFRVQTTLWLVTWIGASLALLDPDRITAIANVFGINRGADLLIYCTALGGLIGFFMLYIRLRQMRNEITLLVRELALRNAVSVQSDQLP